MCSRKDLVQYIRSSKAASASYHKIMALPLLPPSLIKTAFIEIKSRIYLMDSQNKFTSFLNYFENQWLRKVTTLICLVHVTFLYAIISSVAGGM